MADDDVVYVDVVARADTASFDEVERSLKDRLKDATSGISDGLKDLMGGHGGVLDNFKDEFSGIGEKLHESISGALTGREWDSLGKQAGTALGQGVTDALKDITHGNLGGVLDNFGHLGDVLGGALDKVTSKLDSLDKAGGAIGNVLSGKGGGNDLSDIIGGAKDLGLKIPGPINDLEAVSKVVDKLNEHPGQFEDWLSTNIPGMSSAESLIQNGPDQLGTFLHNQITGAPAAGEAHDAASDKWSSSVANEVDVTSENATISASEVSLGGNISLPPGLTSGNERVGGSSAASSYVASLGGGGGGGGSIGAASSGDGYAQLGSYSQGGDITGPGPTGVDSVLAMLAPGERVLTPSQNDAWKSMLHFAGGGETVDVGGGSTGGGSEDSGAGGQGESVDTSGSSDQGGDGGAPGTVGGTEAPGSVQDAADQAQGQGESVDSSAVDPTQEGIAGGTKTSKGIQDQSYGYGKGFSVTGQGLIGFAESAPGAIAQAAASGASGGPAPAGVAAGAGAAALTSLWNSIGEPELNEAITESVKAGADLLSAPQQEFAVGGENFQNWSQKLIGGEIGNVTNLINTAANTQAPLTPQQGSGQAGQVGQAAQPNGNLGGQPSPQGTPNDPMHVSVVGGPSGSDQSSYMSSIGTSSSGTA